MSFESLKEEDEEESAEVGRLWQQAEEIEFLAEIEEEKLRETEQDRHEEEATSSDEEKLGRRDIRGHSGGE